MLGDFVLEVIGTPMMQEESMMDRAASTGFEGIAQMLLEQKKLMEHWRPKTVNYVGKSLTYAVE